MSLNKKTLILDSNSDIYSVIKKIVQQPNQDEPFYVCDVSNLVWKISNWRKLMPRVEIFYATKCNDSQVVLETFAALGTGFDCASKEEIRKVLALGVSASKIIFSNSTKLVSHIKYAREVNVSGMTFDSEAELYKIKEHFPEAELLLRIRCDDKSAKYLLGDKFGALPDTEAGDLLKLAKSLEQNVIGIHFHVGSGSSNYAAYYDSIKTARKVFDIATDLGFKLRLLDIGGGYPGESFKPLDEIAEFINRAVNEFFPDDSVRIIAEPGKYCCNTAFKLVSQINSKKITTDRKNKKIPMYYMDVNVYSSLFCTLFREYYICKPVNDRISSEVLPSILWGSTLDSRDKITEKYDYLPELQIGDWIIFEEIGGYSVSITCEYSGFQSPELYSVIEKDDWKKFANDVSQPIAEDRFTTIFKDFVESQQVPYSFRKNYF